MTSRRANYTIDIDEGIALVDVFKRPDLSLDEGAAAGKALLAELSSLIDRAAIAGQIWDMRHAPLAGPKTRRSITEFFQHASGAGIRSAIVADHPTIKMMASRILEGTIGELGGVFASIADARAFVGGAASDALETRFVPLASPALGTRSVVSDD